MQSVSYGPYVFNKPYIESSLFAKKNPLILHDFIPPKKFLFPLLLQKKQKPLIVNSSFKDSVKTSAVSVFQSLASFDTWVLQSLSNWISFKPQANLLYGGFFEVGDLIRLNHDGNWIVGVVQHIGFLETILIGPVGLIILQNLKIDAYSVENHTVTMGDEKLFGFNTILNCNTNQSLRSFVKDVESVLEKNENVKDNSDYNMAIPMLHNNYKVEVVCYVNRSKLQIPQFKSYLEVKEHVFADIDRNIHRNKAVVDYLKFW